MVTSGATVAAPAGTPVSMSQAMPPSPCSPSDMPQRRSAENRRSNKPIMEKRRRARINNCLNELKTLILDAMKKDPARHSKLEKADILEMTVKHLENMQRQQVALATATDPTVINKYRAGFSECAGEVGRFPGLEPAVRRRLLQHLAACLGNNNSTASVETGPQSPAPAASPDSPLQLQFVSSETSPGQTLSSSNGFFFSTGANGAGLQLVPTRLPNGDIALVLPSSRAGQLGQAVAEQQAEAVVKASPPPSPSVSPAPSPLPMLIPIPQRTASTASATSSASGSSFVSTSTSPAAFDRMSSPPQTQPHNLSTAVHMHTIERDGGASPMPIAFPPSPLSNSSNSCGYDMQYTEEHKPLALVTNRKKYEMEVDDDQPCWRPW
ncbi:protein hairy [Thrips palmi]|uniref:Protein hairy n=1 Tax=Thrips palmi TaxID=161013 RepID=A0A6P8YS74_THRPL|nr:protein hairy [Thrips palmi]